ncbi:MAG: peptide deformylase [Chloroflexi bacterium]|nr:peptide deformylase [Chloroflexota bacterium]
MSERQILTGEHPVLRQKSRRVKKIDESVRRLAAEMKATLQQASGVGLAAPQIGVQLRLIVVEIPADAEEGTEAYEAILCNPEIVRASGEVVAEEACLSLPGWIGEVPRAEKVTVKCLDLEGKERRIRAEGFRARVFQHEIDHLEGILFTDRVVDVSTLRRLSPRDEEAEEPGDIVSSVGSESPGSGD